MRSVKCLHQDIFINEHNGGPSRDASIVIGATVYWQLGDPTISGENGAIIESVIEIARQRLLYHQQGPFACVENGNAIDALEAALASLAARSQRRKLELENIDG